MAKLPGALTRCLLSKFRGRKKTVMLKASWIWMVNREFVKAEFGEGL